MFIVASNPAYHNEIIETLNKLNVSDIALLDTNAFNQLKINFFEYVEDQIAYIEDIESFLKVIEEYAEIIMFPRGNVGNIVLDFLQYRGKLGKISCVTANNIMNDTGHMFNHNKPVIPLKNLVHFRDSAIFIVAAAPQHKAEISLSLLKFGYKSLFINENAYLQIKEKCLELLTPEIKLNHFMSQVLNKLNVIDETIKQSHLIFKRHSEAFAEYKNAFIGKKIVLFASGPTAKYYKPIENALHIGVNFSWRREDVPLDYLFFSDKNINIFLYPAANNRELIIPNFISIGNIPFSPSSRSRSSVINRNFTY